MSMTRDTSPLQPTGVADVLARTPGIVRARLEGTPDDVLTRPLDGGWSPRDVIAHLIDVEDAVFRTRIQRMLTEDEPQFTSIDPTQRLIDGRYRRQGVDALAAELAERRRRSVAFVAALPVEHLDRFGGMDGEPNALTVRSLLQYWVYHDHNHLRQICTMLCGALAAWVPAGWAQ